MPERAVSVSTSPTRASAARSAKPTGAHHELLPAVVKMDEWHAGRCGAGGRLTTGAGRGGKR